MNPAVISRGVAIGWYAVIALAACGSSREPAQHAMEGVESAVTAVAPQAQKYLPDQFVTLKAKANDLQASFEKGDFKQVLADAPTLLNEAQALGAAATAKQDQIVKTLSAEWTRQAESMPDALAAVQARIDSLAKSRKQPAGVDLTSAKASMAEASASWAKAQQAWSGAEVETAVDFMKQAQGKIQAAASALKYSLPTATPAH
jgi:hypothetical protein